MRRPGVLITGASGEIGHGLITRLAAEGSTTIVTLDVRALEPALGRMVHREVIGSITDAAALDRILAEFDIDHVYHLAAYLSTRSEFTPVTAHQVNVEGTMNLLEFSQKQGESHGRPVVFLYPSSVAAYGLPDLETKAKAGKVREEEFKRLVQRRLAHRKLVEENRTLKEQVDLLGKCRQIASKIEFKPHGALNW